MDSDGMVTQTVYAHRNVVAVDTRTAHCGVECGGGVRTDRLTLFAMVVTLTAALVLLPPWGLMTRQ